MAKAAVLDAHQSKVFRADNEAATQGSVLVRIYGRADSQVWPALEWSPLKRLLADLPEAPPASQP